jgi:hypothetical protein
MFQACLVMKEGIKDEPKLQLKQGIKYDLTKTNKIHNLQTNTNLKPWNHQL